MTESFIENGTGCLHYCRIKPFTDDPMTDAHLDLAVQILTEKDTVDKLDRYLFNPTAMTKLSVRCGPRPPFSSVSGEIIRDGAILEQLSLWLSAACPLQQTEKMTFLRSKNTLARLQKCVKALEETKMKNMTLSSDGRWEYSWSQHAANVLAQLITPTPTITATTTTPTPPPTTTTDTSLTSSSSNHQPNQILHAHWWNRETSSVRYNRHWFYLLMTIYSYFHYWYLFHIKNDWMSPSDITTVEDIHYFICIMYLTIWLAVYAWDPLKIAKVHYSYILLIMLIVAFGYTIFCL